VVNFNEQDWSLSNERRHGCSTWNHSRTSSGLAAVGFSRAPRLWLLAIDAAL
jgi:hypothetical protein